MLNKRVNLSFIVLLYSTILILSMFTVNASAIVNVSNNEEYDLFDAMKNQATYNSTVNTEVMNEANSVTSRIFGTLTSCIVYAIFALSTVTTACDLLYIALPPLRSFMYNPMGKQQNMQPYQQMYGNNQRNIKQQCSSGIFERIQKGEGSLISNELRQLMNTPTSMTNAYMTKRPMMYTNYGQQNQMQVPEIKVVVFEYFKKRTLSLVLMAIVMVLLLSSSIFTDCGLNIGEMIMRWLGF